MRFFLRRTLSLFSMSVLPLFAHAEQTVTLQASPKMASGSVYICPMRCGKMAEQRGDQLTVTHVSLTNHSPQQKLAVALIVDGHSKIIASTSVHLSPLDTDELEVCSLLAPGGPRPVTGHVRILFGAGTSGVAWASINSNLAADNAQQNGLKASEDRLGGSLFSPCIAVTDKQDELSDVLRFLYTHKGARAIGGLTAETKDTGAPGVCICGLDEDCTCPPASGTGCVGPCASSPASCEGETATLDLGDGFHVDLCITSE